MYLRRLCGLPVGVWSCLRNEYLGSGSNLYSETNTETILWREQSLANSFTISSGSTGGLRSIICVGWGRFLLFNSLSGEVKSGYGYFQLM